MKEMDVHEWFDLLESKNDNLALRILFNNLDCAEEPSTADMIQLINFLTAVRLHQLRDGRADGGANILTKHTDIHDAQAITED